MQFTCLNKQRERSTSAKHVTTPISATDINQDGCMQSSSEVNFMVLSASDEWVVHAFRNIHGYHIIFV